MADQQKVEICDRSLATLQSSSWTSRGRTFRETRPPPSTEIIRSLARNGKSVVLISHFLSEVLALAVRHHHASATVI